MFEPALISVPEFVFAACLVAAEAAFLSVIGYVFEAHSGALLFGRGLSGVALLLWALVVGVIDVVAAGFGRVMLDLSELAVLWAVGLVVVVGTGVAGDAML